MPTLAAVQESPRASARVVKRSPVAAAKQRGPDPSVLALTETLSADTGSSTAGTASDVASALQGGATGLNGTAASSEAALKKRTVAELKILLAAKHLATSGKKVELIRRLVSYRGDDIAAVGKRDEDAGEASNARSTEKDGESSEESSEDNEEGEGEISGEDGEGVKSEEEEEEDEEEDDENAEDDKSPHADGHTDDAADSSATTATSASNTAVEDLVNSAFSAFKVGLQSHRYTDRTCVYLSTTRSPVTFASVMTRLELSVVTSESLGIPADPLRLVRWMSLDLRWKPNSWTRSWLNRYLMASRWGASCTGQSRRCAASWCCVPSMRNVSCPEGCAKEVDGF